MQQPSGGYTQSGGFDPGLAALIVSLLTGGVGAYGYSKADAAKQESALEATLGADWKEKIATSEKLRLEKKTDEETIKRLEATVAELTAKTKQIAASAAASSGPALAFKNATSEVLTAAADILLQSMAAKYPWVSNAPMLKAALLYPTTYQGRLARMSLPDFYEKRIKPSAQQEYEAAPKGGRARRRHARRGGATEAQQDALAAQPPVFSAEDKERAEQFLNEDEAPAAPAAPAAPVAAPTAPGFPFPSYEEFAQLYSDAITSAQQSAAKGVVSARAAEEARSKAARDAVDAKVQTKKNQAAKKAAGLLAEKLDKAVQRGTTDLASIRTQGLEAQKADVDRLLADATAKTDSLRAVETEEGWKSIEIQSKALLESLPAAVKAYIEAAKAVGPAPQASQAPQPPQAPQAPQAPQSTSLHDALLVDTEALLKKMAGLIKEVDAMKKGLNSALKQLPMPEQYKGGCAVKVIADELTDLLNKLSPLITRRTASLKTSFDAYKKETKRTPIYDTSFRPNTAKLAESKAAIDTAVDELTARIETFFATVERTKRMRGGDPLGRINTLRDEIELGTYALKRYSTNILGLKGSYDTMLDRIDTVKETRLETPAEWEAEKKSCPGQIELLRTELKKQPVVPGAVLSSLSGFAAPGRYSKDKVSDSAPPETKTPDPGSTANSAPTTPVPATLATQRPAEIQGAIADAVAAQAAEAAAAQAAEGAAVQARLDSAALPPASVGTIGDTGLTPAQLVTNVARPGQVQQGDATLGQSLRNLVSPPKKGLKVRKPGQSVTVRKGGKARKSTLKKRRGGK